MRWWNDEHMGIYTPSTHTGGLSENGMHWWNDEHMGIMHPCNAPNLRPLDTNGRIVGKWHALVER